MFGYGVLFLVMCVVSVLLIGVTLKTALRNTAKRELLEQGTALASVIEQQRSSQVQILNKVILARSIKRIDLVTKADIYIVNKRNTLIYQTSDSLSLSEIKDIKNQSGYIYSRTPIYDEDQEIMAYIIMVKEDLDMTRVLRTSQKVALIAMVLSGLLGLIMVYLIQRSITKPIKRLTVEVNQIQNIDQVVLTPVTGQDEVAELHRVFEAMVERLRSAEEEQKRFFQNSSHELKTPLMSIQGYAEAIKDGVISGDETEEGLDIIIAKSQHLKNTVERLILLSKLDNNQVNDQKEELDLTEVIKNWFFYYKDGLQNKNIRLEWESSIKVPCTIKGDGEELIKVMEILLDNALRYARTKISIRMESIEGNKTRIEVCDDGDGIRPSDEAHIFERFYSGANGKSGLGLAIAQSIIQSHNGSIRAYNGVDGGAVFEIIL